MKDKINEAIAWICNSIGLGLTAIQTEQAFKLISLILTILATLLSIALTIWTWWRKAKIDGKLTPEELEELKKKIEEERDKLND